MSNQKSIQKLIRSLVLGICGVTLLFSEILEAATVEVNVSDFVFAPKTVIVKIGDTVRWNWANGTHTTTSGTSGTPNGQWDSGVHMPSFSFEQTFNQAGSFPYFCSVHWQQGMTGTVVVKSSNTPQTRLDNPIKPRIKRGNVRIKLTQVAEGLTAPTWGTAAPGYPGRLFVTDQAGIIWAIDLANGQKTEFADLSGLLVPLGFQGSDTFDERGLLGLAFHPGYRTNGLLYTFTSETVSSPADFSTLPAGTPANCRSVIREWKVTAPENPLSVVNMNSSRVILRIDKPQFNHNGGALNFGADGMLYLSTGDGGNADDQGVGHSAQGNGQDRSNVLGKILRIDPNGRSAPNQQYSIPADNPFVSSTSGGQAGCADGICDEIYAFGLRNPFRFAFDTASGAIFAGDAGQNDIEEVDVIRSGANLGWPIHEGTFCFNANGDDDGFVSKPKNCPGAGMIAPVSQYDHDDGTAIIGGFVYRGSNVRSLRGRYVFGDYAKPSAQEGRLLFLTGRNIVGKKSIRKGPLAEIRINNQQSLGLFLLGFGQDAQGELYVLGNTTGIPFGSTGGVWRIDAP
ncbi:MAG: PQQ-dependent sugar dehydrogenase [Methylomicrobium sp.]